MNDMLRGWVFALSILGGTFALIGAFVLAEVQIIAIIKGG